jgi:uncharacterized protein (UPF0332 family)
VSRQAIIDYWLEKARGDIASAQENFMAGRFSNAVRDAYFPCFHAFSSLLLKGGKTLHKHKEVRSALHRDYIKSKALDPKWGKHYDWLYDNRQKADYRPLVSFESEQVKEIIEQSRAFLKEIEHLIVSV